MRLHRKKQASLIELAVQMIKEVRQWLPKRLFRVVGDGFYATLAGKAMEAVTIISRIRRDANLYDLPPKRRKKKRGRPRKRGKKLAKLEKMAAHIQNWRTVTFHQRGKTVKRLVYIRVVLWYTVSRNPILLVISRDPNGKEKDDFFFTTDVTMDSRWPTAANLQRQRPRTSRWPESLAVLDSMAVVSQAKVSKKIFHCSAVVSPKGHAQLRRCVELPSSRALARKNKMYVRSLCRT